MNLSELKEKVSNHIVNVRLKEAVMLIQENDSIFEFSKQGECIGLLGRISRLNKNVCMGVVTSSSANMQRNRIVQSILHLCDIEADQMQLSVESLSTGTTLNSHPKVSFSIIKNVLKPLKDSNGKVSYSDAIDAIGDLF